METYIVGGAVRDRLLSLPVNDLDFVVTGATREDMLKLGYAEVGADFPVFLHPVTKDEHALARTERSTGSCHKSFKFDCDNITIEEDLGRRDLTINSIAKEVIAGTSGRILHDGNLIDPYGGVKDLNDKVLRHTTDAFKDDPLRVLRLARFKAKFGKSWVVAPETIKMCKEMVSEGLLNELTPERVWMETEKAIKTGSFFLYVDFLYDIGFLNTFMPFYASTKDLSERDDYHPESSLWEHLRLVVDETKKYHDPVLTLAAFMHDAGKVMAYSLTEGKNSGGHDKLGAEILEDWCNTWKVPNKYKSFMVKCARWHSFCHLFTKEGAKPRPKKIVKFLDAFKVSHDSKMFENFLDLCEADHHGRGGERKGEYSPKSNFKVLAIKYQSIDNKSIASEGGNVKENIYRAKLKIIREWIVEYEDNK